MSIYFGEDKTKIILCDTKNKLHQVGTLDIRYRSILIKHNNTVTYLGCSLDKNVSKESVEWPWNLLIKLIVDSDFSIGKTYFYLNLFAGYFVTLQYRPILIMRSNHGTLT